MGKTLLWLGKTFAVISYLWSLVFAWNAGLVETICTFIFFPIAQIYWAYKFGLGSGYGMITALAIIFYIVGKVMKKI